MQNRFCQLVPCLISLVAVLAAESAWSAEPLRLKAGPLSMIFEPDLALLRSITLGEHEVLRGISAPVRDQFWGTVPPQVSDIKLEQSADQFTLKFQVRCREREIDFVWKGKILGRADGHLEYSFNGKAQSEFKRNRIGFCILHGETVAGKSWRLLTSDGQTHSGSFPVLIAPHQPAKNLKEVAHQFAPGLWARVQFEGDVFEMEDQRNWTDASFKTYCTPLEIPYPVVVSNGATVRQKFTLSFEGALPRTESAQSSEQPIRLSINDGKSQLPGIGLRVSSQFDTLDALQTDHLKKLHLRHLRVDLYPANSNFAADLACATIQANLLETKLLMALHFGQKLDEELRAVVAEVRSTNPPVSNCLVVSATPAQFIQVRGALTPVLPSARFGVGEDTNFTELNRNRPTLDGVDVISYGLNPQVHAFDNLSMIETLPIQSETVRSARTFLSDRPILISPITLRIQATNVVPLPGELPSNVDARQPTMFAAAWTLASLKYLSEAGVDSVTYYETVGWKGVMAGKKQDIAPEKFPARPQQVYPIYAVLSAAADFAGATVLETESSQPGSVIGLAMRLGTRHRMIVGNLQTQGTKVAIPNLGPNAGIQRLTAGDIPQWVTANGDQNSLALGPHEIVKIDW